MAEVIVLGMQVERIDIQNDFKRAHEQSHTAEIPLARKINSLRCSNPAL